MLSVIVTIELSNGSLDRKVYECETYDEAYTLEARWEPTGADVRVVEP